MLDTACIFCHAPTQGWGVRTGDYSGHAHQAVDGIPVTPRFDAPTCQPCCIQLLVVMYPVPAGGFFEITSAEAGDAEGLTRAVGKYVENVFLRPGIAEQYEGQATMELVEGYLRDHQPDEA